MRGLKKKEDINYKLISYPQNQIKEYNLILNVRYKGMDTGAYSHIKNMIIIEMLTGEKPEILRKTVKIKYKKEYHMVMMKINIKKKEEFLYKFSKIIYPQYKNWVMRIKKYEKIKKLLGRIHTVKNRVIFYLPISHIIRFLKLEYGSGMAIFLSLWAFLPNTLKKGGKNSQILAFLFASKWGLIGVGDQLLIKNYFQMEKDLLKNDSKKQFNNK